MEKAAKLEAAGEWQQLHALAVPWTQGQPNNSLAWQALGLSLKNLGKRRKQSRHSNRQFLLLPERKLTFSVSLSTGAPRFNLAHTYAVLGNNEAAKDAFREAAAVDPESVVVWTDLGVVCMKSNDAKGAFEAFRKAIALDVTDVNSTKNL